jgi:hypothetical protein
LAFPISTPHEYLAASVSDIVAAPQEFATSVLSKTSVREAVDCRPVQAVDLPYGYAIPKNFIPSWRKSQVADKPI